MIRTLKSIWAVLAGMIVIIVLSVGSDWLMEVVGIFPPVGTGKFMPWMLMIALVYRSIYAVVGGYIAAALAPGFPLRHAIVLGVVGLVLATLGAIIMWSDSDAWYPLALIVTALPCTWLGGKLKK